MWPYWFMFLVPAIAAMQESVRSPKAISAGQSAPMPWEWRWTMLVLLLLVGFRHQVGGDWFQYLDHFQSAAFESRYSEWWWNDPGYRVLLWLGLQGGWTVHAVNLMGGAFFSYGLILFCRSLPRPWLALAVSIPYVVLILGMGYSRQGFALGCVMAGLVALQQHRTVPFVIWVVLGATFHKSAIIMLPIAAMVNSERRLITLLWLAIIGFFSYALLLEQSLDTLRSGYLDAAMQSEGALVRLLMNAVPALLFLKLVNRFKLSSVQKRLWTWLALISLILLAIYFVSSSSTAVDRIGLYALPIQLMVFAYLPEVLGNSLEQRSNYAVMILCYYGAVEFVWLNFAKTAFAWLPYRFYPLEGMF